MDSVKFFQRVWKGREGWVDIPSKVNGHWIPWSVEWDPADTELLQARLGSCVTDEEDVYFSPAQFRSRGRRYADVLPTYWLWADLDTVTPQTCVELGVAPTLCWSSSPGRYQALWELDHACSPAGIEKLNRRLTYALDADKSGWDLTQVLRVPGTRNFKYEGGPEVTMVMETDEIYHPKKLARKLASVRPSALRKALKRGSIESLIRADATIPAQAQTLLKAQPSQVVKGERSTQLWKLECQLVEAGFSGDEVFDMVWGSVWNKWRDVNTGAERLRREIRKAQERVLERRAATPTPLRETNGVGPSVREVPEGRPVSPSPGVPETSEKRETSPFVAYGNFLSANIEAPRWLVRDLWTAESHGIFGGEPKSMKSVLSLALGMSVASGKPFLGDARFKVGSTGPVLMVQEENDPWRMQELMRKIARFYGLIAAGEVETGPSVSGAAARRVVRLQFPQEIPFKLLNNYGFDMTVDEHRELLEEEIRSVQPSLLILDPFYLMIGGADVNSGRELSPFFKWLIHLKFQYGCAVLVNHHFRKQTANGPQVRPGQRVLGTTTLHAWVANALYAENTTEEGDAKNVASVRLEREFRNTSPLPALDLRLMMGGTGDLKFDAEVQKYDAVGELVKLVRQEPGILVTEVAKILDIDKRTIVSRARGSGLFTIKGRKVGRGHSWQLWLRGTEGG